MSNVWETSLASATQLNREISRRLNGLLTAVRFSTERPAAFARHGLAIRVKPKTDKDGHVTLEVEMRCDAFGQADMSDLRLQLFATNAEAPTADAVTDAAGRAQFPRVPRG